MSEEEAKKTPTEEEATLRLDFSYIDKDGSGSITVAELQNAFMLRGHDMTREEIEALIAKVDKDKSGTVEFNEFAKLAEILEEMTLEELEKQHESLEKEHEEEVKSFQAEKVIFAGEDGMILGPVIGKVTADTARVLVEMGKEATVVLRYREEGGEGEQTMEQLCPGSMPTVFRLTGLKPGTKYTLSFDEHKDRMGSFRTFNPEQKQFRMVAASCDKGKKYRGKVNMYDKLYEEYIQPGKIDLLVRHGDQVYADSAFKTGEQVLQDESVEEKDKDATILKNYQDVYRTCWNEPDVMRVHANVQTLMLWDDHELRNDWGSFKQDIDPTHQDWRICLQARRAYWMYQRQLWDDIEPRTEEQNKSRLNDARIFLNRGALQALDVKVLAAHGLRNGDKNSGSDPFAEVALLAADGRTIGSSVRSKMLQNTHDPTWHYHALSSKPPSGGCCSRDPCSWRISKGELERAYTLRVRIYDYDRLSSNDFLGEVNLQLRTGTKLKNGSNELWCHLKESLSNEVNTKSLYIAPEGKVQLKIEMQFEELDSKKAADRLLDSEGSFHSWGQFGLMIVDGRGCRSFYHQPGDLRPFLGGQQWHHITQALGPDGQFKEVTNLAVVHSMPPVLISTHGSKKVGKIPPQLDKMGFGLHPKEQTDYLGLLDSWAHGEKDKKKNFILIGGDMHFAVLTDVSWAPSPKDAMEGKVEKRRVCQQLILSAISNKTPPKPVYWMLRKFMKGHGILGDSRQQRKFLFFHKQYHYERNFGVVDMSSDQGIVPSIVTAKAVHSDQDDK